MTRDEFNTIWHEVFSSLKTRKGTVPQKAVELYCGYIHEKGAVPDLTCTEYLRRNGRNPEAPLFGYTTATSAIYNGKYLLTKLQLACHGEDITGYVGDWREEPELFPAEAPEPPQDVTEILGHVVHMARTLDDVSAKLDALIGKIDKLIELETRAMNAVLGARA